MRDTTKWPGKLEHRGRDPKEDPRQTWKEGIQNILKERGVEWNGVRDITRNRERWKALCKRFTPTGRRGAIKRSEVKK
jgi:hypothetical protein